MFGSFQSSRLRIEVNASESAIRQALTQTTQLQQWLWPQQLAAGLPDQLQAGLRFTSWAGPIAVQHQVEQLDADRVCFLLSQGIDGFHEWSWGEGWLQSRLEGVSVLPLNLGQTFSLLKLRQFLESRAAER